MSWKMALFWRTCSTTIRMKRSRQWSPAPCRIRRGENGAPTLTVGPEVEASPENARALTQRELEVLRLVSLGWRTPRIADELGISYHTVRNHIRHCRRKLGAATKLDAVLTAIRRGILPVG